MKVIGPFIVSRLIHHYPYTIVHCCCYSTLLYLSLLFFKIIKIVHFVLKNVRSALSRLWWLSLFDLVRGCGLRGRWCVIDRLINIPIRVKTNYDKYNNEVKTSFLG